MAWPGFKPGRGRQPFLGKFDSYCLPPFTQSSARLSIPHFVCSCAAQATPAAQLPFVHPCAEREFSSPNNKRPGTRPGLLLELFTAALYLELADQFLQAAAEAAEFAGGVGALGGVVGDDFDALGDLVDAAVDLFGDGSLLFGGAGDLRVH